MTGSLSKTLMNQTLLVSADLANPLPQSSGLTGGLPPKSDH